jgi:hypothetical protein
MKKKIMLIQVIAVLLIFAACNRNYLTQSYSPESGRLKVSITDAQFKINYIESATVTISKIEIRKAGGNNDSTYLTLSAAPVTTDLLGLRNGIVKVLTDLQIPKGKYDLIRLYIEEADLKIKNNPVPFTVKIPSGQQTGIKIFLNPVLEVEGGLTSELLLDFDLSRSFILRGNLDKAESINGFIFKPVIRATNLSNSGRLEGYVVDSLQHKISNTMVWIARDSLITTTFTDTLGFYAILGIPSGIYTAGAAKDGFDTVKFDDVLIYSANKTIRNFFLSGR